MEEEPTNKKNSINIKNNTSQQGIRGIFIGFPRNQKGYQIYIPSTRKAKISLDVEFDEYFKTAIAYTWKPFNDSLFLRPSTGNSNLPNDPAEHTGDISDYIRLEEEVKNKGTIHIKSLTSENEMNPHDTDGEQEAEKERLM